MKTIMKFIMKLLNQWQRILLAILFSFVFIACQTWNKTEVNYGKSDNFKVDAQWGQWSDTDDSRIINAKVILIPQWHLAPHVNTNDPKYISKPETLPQSQNQIAIYNAILNLEKEKFINGAVVEGCEGSIKNISETKYNGWSLNDLKNKIVNHENISQILTQVGIKLAAEFDKNKSFHVDCGDDLKLIKEHQMVLSDIRGLMGFFMRIQDSKLRSQDKLKYFEGVKEVLNLKKNTIETEVLRELKSSIRVKIKHYELLIHDRNKKMVEIANHKEDGSNREYQGRKVIVIGALHIEDLKQQLSEQKIHYTIWTPVGIQGIENDPIAELKNFL